ncbi:universal stress protein [Paludibacter sp. 221]|uniref:universal stress protein n=1 Tax=Paludibacter sp. 221 TaxID=2302939 RepID=UPI0013D86477|nr:universal stress protein [Paludibacter sp. 221]NDV46767.1 universal stress protein [Paludibacter sp. 221]
MILTFIQHTGTAKSMLQSAFALSVSLKKEFGVLLFVEDGNRIPILMDELRLFLESENLPDTKIFVRENKLSELSQVCEEIEASFLFLQLADNRSQFIQKYLTACRGLRIPYLLYKESFSPLDLKKVLVPVTFLEEEYEKAQFASAFGRFCQSQITLLLANDYGSKARTTADKMMQLFDKFKLNYTLEVAKSDSFKIEKESVSEAEKQNYDIVLLSASRDYGLDDILFGPKEQHLVKKSLVPVLLINPRGDLYSLCD